MSLQSRRNRVTFCRGHVASEHQNSCSQLLSEPLAIAPPRAFFEILPRSIFIAPYVGQTLIFWPFFRLFSTFGAYNFLTNQKLKKSSRRRKGPFISLSISICWRFLKCFLSMASCDAWNGPFKYYFPYYYMEIIVQQSALKLDRNHFW